jgi:O-antigen polysaccharide polymerase Wzy
MNRSTLYWSVNAGFMVLVAIGALLGSASNIHPLYLILLFALCSTPIFNTARFNDRYVLLVLFSVVYFQFYGMVDLITLFKPIKVVASTNDFISETELLILLGGTLVQIAYRQSCKPGSGDERTPKDWSEQTLVLLGFLIWSVATWFTWQFKVNILTAATAAATSHGLASLSGLQTVGYLLAVMLQPLGILILAYAQCRYQRFYMLPLLIGVVLVQVVLGFVVDVKGDTLIGVVLVVVTRLLVNGKLPKNWLIASAVFIALAFPAMQANRTLRGQYRIDHAEAAQNLVETVKQAFALGEQVKTGDIKAQNVFERQSLKGSVEMIVTRTGQDVPYQHGYTLSPLYLAFIPRIIWPDKPDIQTGQLVNKEFQVTNIAYVYISPSHLGELYWNFGWPGVIIGLSLLGWLLGYLGKCVDMTRGASITLLMVAAVTTKQLILGFEGGIADIYVVWLRTMAAILLLHWLLARRQTADSHQTNSAPTTAGSDAAFPNLLR